MKVVALGGAGAMGRHAVEAALDLPAIRHLVIADREGGRAATLAARWPGRAGAAEVDIDDAGSLARAVDGADVVLNTVGPFFRHGARVLDAAIAAGCHYLDICDDWEPALEMLARDAVARAAGISAVVGMGASPGVTNLLAAAAARTLDRVDALHTGWSLLGADEGAEQAGSREVHAAVVHFLHQITGTIRVWRAGGERDARPLEEVAVEFPGLGAGTGWTVGHPEAVTLPRAHRALRDSVNLVLAPGPVIEALRGLAQAVDAGGLTIDQAAALLVAGGTEELANAAADDLAARLPLFALATGSRDGRPATVGATVRAMPGTGMGGATGVPLAVGLDLLVRGQVGRRGVLAPEEAFVPEAFFDALARRCTPPLAGHRDLVRLAHAA